VQASTHSGLAQLGSSRPDHLVLKGSLRATSQNKPRPVRPPRGDDFSHDFFGKREVSGKGFAEALQDTLVTRPRLLGYTPRRIPEDFEQLLNDVEAFVQDVCDEVAARGYAVFYVMRGAAQIPFPTSAYVYATEPARELPVMARREEGRSMATVCSVNPGSLALWPPPPDVLGRGVG
jgi:hypothetical protein